MFLAAERIQLSFFTVVLLWCIASVQRDSLPLHYLQSPKDTPLTLYSPERAVPFLSTVTYINAVAYAIRPCSSLLACILDIAWGEYPSRSSRAGILVPRNNMLVPLQLIWLNGTASLLGGLCHLSFLSTSPFTYHTHQAQILIGFRTANDDFRCPNGDHLS